MATGTFQPVIMIGAARSGTKALRDTIAMHPQFDRVPFDVSYIWRLGNEGWPHDELATSQLTPAIRNRIMREISRYSTKRPFLIEKTVGNCLRVPFVHRVFPDARFIHLIRDGRDVVESAIRQWKAPPDWTYIWQKARSFPLRVAPRYAAKYALSTCKRLLGGRAHSIPKWGPLYSGIDDDIRTQDLLAVCARQWAVSVERALEGLASIPPEQVLEIRYEDFVASPDANLQRIIDFIGADRRACDSISCAHISSENTGKGMRGLSNEQQEQVLSIIVPTLTRLDYVSQPVKVVSAR